MCVCVCVCVGGGGGGGGGGGNDKMQSPNASLLGRSTVMEYAEVAADDPVMYGDGGLALSDTTQLYCPESRDILRAEKTIMDR